MGDQGQVDEKKEIDLSKPRWDQHTYVGRAKHFLTMTNPLNCLATPSQLDEAKRVVDEFKKTKRIPEGYNEDKLWAAKYLYDSAFHPDTGEKMMMIGRMSAQAPMNTIITGAMITFYKTTPQTVFWQWVNQSFNAIVNYTNRSGDAPISNKTLFASYCGACGGALSTALYLNSRVKHMNPIYARMVPFAAVAAANFINIPMMRSSELMNGVAVYSENGEMLGTSKKAARKGVSLVVISRVIMATPGMVLTPMLTNYGTRKGWFKGRAWAVLPFQCALVAVCLTFATPLACALFDQRAAYPVSMIEPEIKEVAEKKNISTVYFNKGL